MNQAAPSLSVSTVAPMGQERAESGKERTAGRHLSAWSAGGLGTALPSGVLGPRRASLLPSRVGVRSWWEALRPLPVLKKGPWPPPGRWPAGRTVRPCVLTSILLFSRPGRGPREPVGFTHSLSLTQGVGPRALGGAAVRHAHGRGQGHGGGSGSEPGSSPLPCAGPGPTWSLVHPLSRGPGLPAAHLL